MDDDQKIREVLASLDRVDKEIEKIAEDFNLTYEEMMSAADAWLAGGDYVILPFDTPSADWDRFWDLYERARGVRDPNNDCFFSCSC
jgi:hypothetical protein